MELLPNETLLLESDTQTLKLTTHRVRYESRHGGEVEIRSIMLEELASCEVMRSAKPILLVLAAVCLLLGGLAAAQNSQSGALLGGVIVGLIFVVLYFATRQQFLVLASAGASIHVNARSMKLETLRGFVDAVENAKNDRYLLTAATTYR